MLASQTGLVNCFSVRLFKEKFVVEYMFPVWGLICYLVPGLNTRRRIITELRAMFRQTIRQHSHTIDINEPRWEVGTSQLLIQFYGIMQGLCGRVSERDYQ